MQCRLPLRPAHPVAVILLLAVVARPHSAGAAFVQDTVVVVAVSPAPPPDVAINPTDATPHVAVRTTTGYLHLWRVGGVWQQETIALAGAGSGIFGFGWAIGATGRPALLSRG